MIWFIHLSVYLLLFNSITSIDYKDLVDTTKPDVPVNIDATDLEDTNYIDEIDIRPAIIDELQKDGVSVDAKTLDYINDPISKSSRFQGDIVVAVHDDDDAKNVTSGVAYNAIKNKFKHWPGGIVPYMVSSQYGKHSRKLIATAAAEFEKYTCVKFIPRTDEKDFIYIQPHDGCFSGIGKSLERGSQRLSLAPPCLHKHVIIHEMMHAIGFFHEQARYDRDKYITVQYGNIERDMWDQYTKQGPETITLLDTPYDTRSLMHYEGHEFRTHAAAMVGGRTIVAKDGGKLGNNRGFTANDILKINKLYECPDQTTLQPPPGEMATQRPMSKCQYSCTACSMRAAGPDLGAVGADTAEVCCAKCHERKQCAAFTWTRGTSMCWLHAAGYSNNIKKDCGTDCWFAEVRPDPKRLPTPKKCQYKCKACEKRGTNSGLVAVSTNTADICCSECQKRPKCKAFTWTKNDSTCWMHTAAYKNNMKSDCGHNCWFSEM